MSFRVTECWWLRRRAVVSRVGVLQHWTAGVLWQRR